MTPLVERIIYTPIAQAFAALRQEPATFEVWLILSGVGSDEAARAKQFVIDNPITVTLGYPRFDAKMPCIAITVGAENVALDFIGEDVIGTDADGHIEVDADGNRIDVHSRRWEHRFDLFVYANNADVCSWLYGYLKETCLRARTAWVQADLDEIQLSGAELAPDPRYLPADIYVRRFSISCRSDSPYAESLHPGIGPGTTAGGCSPMTVWKRPMAPVEGLPLSTADKLEDAPVAALEAAAVEPARAVAAPIEAGDCLSVTQFVTARGHRRERMAGFVAWAGERFGTSAQFPVSTWNVHLQTFGQSAV